MASKRNTLKAFTTAKNHGTEASYQIAHCIAKRGKPFTDGENKYNTESMTVISFF